MHHECDMETLYGCECCVLDSGHESESCVGQTLMILSAKTSQFLLSECPNSDASCDLAWHPLLNVYGLEHDSIGMLARRFMKILATVPFRRHLRCAYRSSGR